MSNEAITWAFKQKLPHTDKFVLIALADYADDEMSCYPSHKKTAERVGMSIATVKRAVTRLTEGGYVKVQKRNRSDGSITSNRYFIDIHRDDPPAHPDPRVTGDPTPGHSCDPTPAHDGDPTPGHSCDPAEPAFTHQVSITHPDAADAAGLLLSEDVSEDSFEEWWKLYPLKQGRSKARDAYALAIKKHKHVQLVKLLEDYLSARESHKKAGEFVPNLPCGSTWLNQERWTDYMGAPAPQSKTEYSPWEVSSYER